MGRHRTKPLPYSPSNRPRRFQRRSDPTDVPLIAAAAISITMLFLGLAMGLLL